MILSAKGWVIVDALRLETAKIRSRSNILWIVFDLKITLMTEFI